MKRFLMVWAAALALSLVSGGAFAAPQPAGKQAPHAAAAEDPGLSGKVVETMNAGGYSYVLIEKDGKKTWVAMPTAPVRVGQELTFQPGGEMKNFTSPTLKRTFDSIIFSAGLKPQAGHGAGAKTPAPRAGHAAGAKASSEKISVEKAAGPDAYTVSEIYKKKAALNEKTAVVRGKVVKVTQGVMGRNFIHLQDGTGDEASGTNKLVVTSQDLPAVGDLVTMKGTIYTNKDFGSGYKYAVIMEKASIQR